MNIYRGDTLKFDFSATLEDGTIHNFQSGDILKAGIKQAIRQTEYMMFKQVVLQEDTDTVTFEFSHEEAMQLREGDAILEVELTDTAGRVSTLYQEDVDIRGDVINE